MRELAAARVSYGYRRLHLLLRREEWKVNHKLVYRLWLEMNQEYRDDFGFSDVTKPTLEDLRDRAMYELNLKYTTRRLRDIVKSGDEGYLK